MKRSKAVALSLMSASAILLQACDDPDVEAQVFRDVQNCIDTGQMSQQDCVDLHQQAVANHLETAPRYRSREECYAEFGPEQCQPQGGGSGDNAGGGGIWMPLMMGFVAARALDSFSGRNSTPLYRSRTDAGGGLRTGDGQKVGAGYGAKTNLPGWATQPSRSRTDTVSRGGFGARATSSGG